MGDRYNHDAQMTVAEMNDMVQKSISDDMLRDFYRKDKGKAPTADELVNMRDDLKKYLYMQNRGADAVSVSASLGPFQYSAVYDELTGEWYDGGGAGIGQGGKYGFKIASHKLYDISNGRYDLSDKKIRKEILGTPTAGVSLYTPKLIGGGVSTPMKGEYSGKVISSEIGLGTAGGSLDTSGWSKKDVMELLEEIAKSKYIEQRKKDDLKKAMENLYGSE